MQFLSAEFLVLAQVKIGAGMNAFQFLEAHGKTEFDIRGRVGIMSQFLMRMKTIVFLTQTQSQVPLEAGFLPFFVPFQLSTGAHEKLHFHLLKFAHAENELTCHDFVAKRFSRLGYPERNFHTARFLYIQKIHKNTLRRFGPQIDGGRILAYGTHLRTEHEIELTNLGPVARSADGAYDFTLFNDLFQVGHVVLPHGFIETGIYRLPLLLIFLNAWIGFAEKNFIKGLSETLGGFVYLLIDFIFNLAQVILNQVIRAIALLTVLVVDHGIIEGIHVTRGFPRGGMHKNRRVDAHDVVVHVHHALPPIFADIFFQFDTVLSVIINGTETVVNFAGWKNEPVFFGVGNDFFKQVVLHVIWNLMQK